MNLQIQSFDNVAGTVLDTTDKESTGQTLSQLSWNLYYRMIIGNYWGFMAEH